MSLNYSTLNIKENVKEQDRKGHDFKYELSTKHNLEAVKCQQSFSMTETIKYYVEKYKTN